MEIRYKVTGTNIMGDMVKINLQRSDLVQEKESFNPFESMTEGKELDLEMLMKKTQNMAVKMSINDSITVSYDEWKKQKINVDDIILVEVSKEK